ncbi:Tyrosinase-like protein orsC [Apiospora marii]|uniref:Tyrosinase-like protein orsC n=2 Tax=Apiospora marii TaxID=335849 RepID=A0ABR1RCU6_9PEZI
MRVSLCASAALFAAGTQSVLTVDERQDANTIMAELQKQATEALVETNTGAAEHPADGCFFGNAHVRQDGEKLDQDHKRDYIKAVQCMADSPTRLTQYGWASKNRYDDFFGVHINKTTSIHATGNFLTYHRYFVYLWEKALRKECGYQGYQPYWNWFKYADDLSKSPVFDGSMTSMGGDGEYFPHNGSMGGGNTIYFPPGRGGGCVTSGPFNLTINLGPITPRMNGLLPVSSLYEWNPRCLRRDLTMAASRFLNAENLINITVGDASHTIELFQDELQGARTGPDFLGMHGSGHFSMGADGTDLYASINDPAFWLHHAMLDRVYWVWQALHPTEKDKIAGGTVMREPDSAPARLGDLLDVMGLDDNRPIKDLLDTLGETPLCYVYE